MPETELSRALQDITPEPPNALYADELLQRAKRRRTLRLAMVCTAPLAVAAVAVMLHAPGRAPSVAIDEPTPKPTAVSPEPAPSEPAPVTTTRGQADVDGDGRIDEVTLSNRTGVVTLSLAGGPTLRATLPVWDLSNRLQAIADLWGTGTKQILVYSSASGCCADHPSDSQSYVLTLVGDRLELVRTGSEPLRLYFSEGRGDNYADITCVHTAHEVVQTTFTDRAPHQATRIRTTITLSGSTATVSSPSTNQLQGRFPQDLDPFAVARNCPGLASNGTGTP